MKRRLLSAVLAYLKRHDVEVSILDRPQRTTGGTVVVLTWPKATSYLLLGVDENDRVTDGVLTVQPSEFGEQHLHVEHGVRAFSLLLSFIADVDLGVAVGTLYTTSPKQLGYVWVMHTAKSTAASMGLAYDEATVRRLVDGADVVAIKN